MTKAKSTYLALIAVLVSPMAANAELIEITGAGDADGLWELSIVFGLATDPALIDIFDDQVWWGDSALAELFSNTCMGCLGLPNPSPFPGLSYGAYFAYQDYNDTDSLGWGYQPNTGFSIDWIFGGEFTWSFATASRVTVPEPGSFALLGIGLLGMRAAKHNKEGRKKGHR